MSLAFAEKPEEDAPKKPREPRRDPRPAPSQESKEQPGHPATYTLKVEGEVELPVVTNMG